MFIIKLRIPQILLLVLCAFFIWIPPLHTPYYIVFLGVGILTLCVVHRCDLFQLCNDAYARSLLMYSVVVLISEVVYEKDLYSIFNTCVYVLVPITIYIVISQKLRSKNSFRESLMVCTLIYFILDIYFAFCTQTGAGTTPTGQNLYFSGDKFQTCYIYILLMTLIMLQRGNGKIIDALLILFGVFYALYVDCSTGALGILVFGLVIFAPRFFLNKSRIYVWLGFLISLSYLIVVLRVQNIIPGLRYLIEVVLHRDMSMTGRMVLYENVPAIMAGHWILGCGYTSNYLADITGKGKSYGYNNMQNGFLQIIYQSGVAGFLLFMIIVIIVINRLNSIKNERNRAVLSAALSAFFIAAIVEIPFDFGAFQFVIGLVLLESQSDCLSCSMRLKHK